MKFFAERSILKPLRNIRLFVHANIEQCWTNICPTDFYLESIVQRSELCASNEISSVIVENPNLNPFY